MVEGLHRRVRVKSRTFGPSTVARTVSADESEAAHRLLLEQALQVVDVLDRSWAARGRDEAAAVSPAGPLLPRAGWPDPAALQLRPNTHPRLLPRWQPAAWVGAVPLTVTLPCVPSNATCTLLAPRFWDAM